MIKHVYLVKKANDKQQVSWDLYIVNFRQKLSLSLPGPVAGWPAGTYRVRVRVSMECSAVES